MRRPPPGRQAIQPQHYEALLRTGFAIGDRDRLGIFEHRDRIEKTYPCFSRLAFSFSGSQTIATPKVDASMHKTDKGLSRLGHPSIRANRATWFRPGIPANMQLTRRNETHLILSIDNLNEMDCG
jgi:hypothetical protein